jgi:hypothetical protein
MSNDKAPALITSSPGDRECPAWSYRIYWVDGSWYEDWGPGWSAEELRQRVIDMNPGMDPGRVIVKPVMRGVRQARWGEMYDRLCRES